MRAQFKGFMSGMQAKQPAPAASDGSNDATAVADAAFHAKYRHFSAFYAHADGNGQFCAS